MKYLLRLLVLCISVLPTWVLADTPVGPMNYQGRLLDDGVPVGFPTPTPVNFVVRVYNAASGGTLKYQETHNGVTVDDGVYSFLIGTQPKDAGDSTWSVELWNCCANLFLEITANGETLLPRSRLAAAPYAFQANLALTTNNALALGGKPSTWFDNTMEAICVSGKGKWLELANDGAGACLGIGSSYPGPATVPYLDLTTDGDFTNIDLTNADISGIQFDDATMTGTIFKGTTYSVEGMSGANLRDTVWDAAVATDQSAYQVSSTTRLSGATIKNMDMSNWNLSQLDQSKVDGLSAAILTACPAGMPASWECRDQGLSDNRSFLLGPGVNLSANSAAAVSKFGSSYLNLGLAVLNDMDLTGATFEGNVVTQNFNNTLLTNANFNYATLRSNIFDTCDLTGTSFVNGKIDKPTFKGTSWFTNANFTNADLSFVRFNVKGIDGNNFTNATLSQVVFSQDVRNSNFTNAVLDEVKMLTSTQNNIFDGTRFYHGFQHGGTVRDYSHNYGGGSTFNNLVFNGGNLTGDFTGATFTGTNTFDGVNSSFGLFICGTTFPLEGGVVPGWSIGLGAACPDGNTYTNCNSGSHMTPIPVAQCPAAF